MKIRNLCVIAGAALIMLAPAKSSKAQYATIEFSDKYAAYIDSIKNVDYDFIFPILGKQAYKSGFDVPYPAGVMVNYMMMKQHIVISDFSLGFHSSSGKSLMIEDADFIKFGDNTNVAYTTTVRPDIWILPFLNVYGLFGYGRTNTDINISHIALPNYNEAYSQIP
ncbi:MAG: hypothetical protein ACK5HT_15250, partial [Draconibacterium sp.]